MLQIVMLGTTRMKNAQAWDEEGEMEMNKKESAGTRQLPGLHSTIRGRTADNHSNIHPTYYIYMHIQLPEYAIHSHVHAL